MTQISGTDRLDFAYDEAGSLYGFFYQNTPYLYVKNAQGDITAILDDSGDAAIYYEYDSWGNVTKITDNTDAKVIGKLNPFRYRGYYFDQESELYYLQSRYYDAGTGRFINADAYILTSQGIIGHNLFAYCLNNPVNKIDETGTFAIEIILGIGVLLVAVVTCVVHVVQNNQRNNTIGKRPSNSYDPMYEGLDDIIETTETIITVITYLIESVSNDGEKGESKNDKKGKNKDKSQEDMGDADIRDLKRLPDKKIKELGGESYTQPAKSDGGKSKSNLYWNPKTGDVYVLPNASNIPQYIDTIPIK